MLTILINLFWLLVPGLVWIAALGFGLGVMIWNERRFIAKSRAFRLRHNY